MNVWHGRFHRFGDIAFGDESVAPTGVNDRVRSR